nr:8094_t:CDS:2 [Entrophospora candida]
MDNILEYDSSSEEILEDSNNNNDDNDNGNPLSNALVKRKFSDENLNQTIKKKKISSLPPLPTEFLQLYSDNKVHIDNPDEHQGRVRTKLHVEGNWATHVYMEVIIPEDFEDLLKNIKIQSESFLNNNEKEIKVFSCLEEEESELLKLLDKDVLKLLEHINSVVKDFRQEEFYKDPKFHSSILWALGNSINNSLCNHLKNLGYERKIQGYNFIIEKMVCKIGNRIFSVKLL